MSTKKEFLDSEFKIEWFKGSGKGGQHRNKHANSARVIHIPTGLKQERQGRSREKNYADAKKALLDTLTNNHIEKLHLTQGSIRSSQIGSGMRGDKRRTYRFKDDCVVDHVSGKKSKCSKVMRGMFGDLHN